MRALSWASLLVAGLWLPMSLTYPFGWDQGLFAWAGGVILRGGMPYADAWDMKGPLAYYIYALAQMIFGVHLWGIRALDAAAVMVATVAVFRVAKSLTDPLTARWACLIFFLWYASHSFWNTAQPDGWTGMILILALSPILMPRPHSRVLTVVCAGLGVGLATLFKPLWAAFLLLPFIAIAGTQRQHRLRLSLCLLAAWCLPVAVTVLWFVYRGAFDDLVAVHIRYSALYATLTPSDRVRGLIDYLLSSRVVVVSLPVVLHGAIVLWRSRRWPAILLVTWVLVVVLGVAAQGRFYAYHWLPLLPAATLLGAVSLHEIRLTLPALARVLTAVIAFHCVAPIVLEEMRFLAWIAGVSSRDKYYDGYGEAGDDLRVVRWLREQGRPGDVYLFGWQGGIPWLSERRVVSRFGFSMPLMIGQGLEIRERYRAELLEALTATPPVYILLAPQSQGIIGAVVTVDDFPALKDLVSTRYHEVARVGAITIHEIGR